MSPIKYNYMPLKSFSLYDNFPIEYLDRISLSNKKVILLDLDETLIHADFKEEFIGEDNIFCFVYCRNDRSQEA